MSQDLTVARYVPPVSIPDMRALAEAIARSKLFGMQTMEQALVLMALSQAEGRHPVLAARDYDIIQGRPSKKAGAMLRDFLTCGGVVEWHELTDEIAEATFAHPAGGTVKIRWDMERARKAGLATKDLWRKYPRAMLRSRCVSEGVGTVCPMATSGMYVPEEVADFDDKPKRTPRASEAWLDHEAPAAEPAGETIDTETGEVFDPVELERAAREVAAQGWKALAAHLKALPDLAYDILAPLVGRPEHPGELRRIAREADEARRSAAEATPAPRDEGWWNAEHVTIAAKDDREFAALMHERIREARNWAEIERLRDDNAAIDRLDRATKEDVLAALADRERELRDNA